MSQPVADEYVGLGECVFPFLVGKIRAGISHIIQLSTRLLSRPFPTTIPNPISKLFPLRLYNPQSQLRHTLGRIQVQPPYSPDKIRREKSNSPERSILVTHSHIPKASPLLQCPVGIPTASFHSCFRVSHAFRSSLSTRVPAFPFYSSSPLRPSYRS